MAAPLYGKRRSPNPAGATSYANPDFVRLNREYLSNLHRLDEIKLLIPVGHPRILENDYLFREQATLINRQAVLRELLKITPR